MIIVHQRFGWRGYRNCSKTLYLSNQSPDIPKSAMKSLLKLAVTNVRFKCNGLWYVQSDGLAMDASLPLILANVWMKSFEKSLQNQSLVKISPDPNNTEVQRL